MFHRLTLPLSSVEKGQKTYRIYHIKHRKWQWSRI